MKTTRTGLTVLVLLAAVGAQAETSHCNTTACPAPSQRQAEVLFGKVEQRYPQFFAPASTTDTLDLGGDAAHYRTYARTRTALGTYQGGLWYQVDNTWHRFSNLEVANREFCGNRCWAYPVVDTGQTASYNTSMAITAPAAGQAFHGQDAQVAGAAPSYALSSDGKVVTDQVTQLMWMRGPNTTLTTPASADKKTYAAAQAWVATINAMNYGGYGDWRLPTIKELYSLMIFTGTDPSGYSGTSTVGLTPFIDTNYFNFGYGQSPERIIDSQYASSTLFTGQSADTGSSMLFGLNLADGRIKGYDLSTPNGGDKTFFVQLVRGVAGYGENSFIANGDGTVTDIASGLMWSQADSGSAMNWQDALAWVQTMNAAQHLGHDDWRLPNAKELQSLVNYANAPDVNGKPAIDTSYFTISAIINENGETDYPYFWTSTTHATYNGGGASAVYVPFGRALGYSTRLGKWIDVHGAGCQRSDPKLGPPYSEYTTHRVSRNGMTYLGYAHGPQNDAIRGLNYVRLVR